MYVSRVLLLLVAAVAVATTTEAMAVDTPCTAARYADMYASVQTQIAACETASGVSPLELPLTNKKKLALCDACLELVALAKAKTLPTCTITQSNGDSYTLRQQVKKLFNKCTGDSGSGSDAASKESMATSTTTAPATTTSTPTPTVTTKTPSTTISTTKSSSSASTSTTPTANSESSATASSVAGDADDGATPATSTISKAATSAPTSSSTNANDASGFKNDAPQQTSGNDKGSSLSIGIIAGVVVGVLVVAAASVFIVMTRRRRKDDDVDKYDNVMPDSSRELMLDIPFHNAMCTVNLNGNSDFNDREDKANPALSVAVAVASVTQGHLWDDPLIVAARIPKDKVVATMLLSRGGFGEVYRGIYNSQQVAIKTLLPETRKDMREINLFLIEVKLMARLEHERIVQFVGVAWDSLTDLCVVTEYMEGGDLRDLLKLFEQASRPHGFDQSKVKIAMHVAHALTYMHSLQPIVLHRDLKSKNILLDTQMNAKLTDFGVSRERSDSTMTASVGTPLWMAPEVMLGRRYDHKADIFSFGVVLSELDSHALPYSNATLKISRSNRPVPDSAMLKLISLGQLSVEFSANAPRELVAIAEACVTYNPADRPSAADVLYSLHNVLRELHMSVSF